MSNLITDHTPSQYEQHRDVTFLLEIVEYTNLQFRHPVRYDWIRLATYSEIEYEVKLLEGRDDINQLQEHKGKEYVWVTVLRNAPGHIWRRVTGYLRLEFLEDDKDCMYESIIPRQNPQ